MAWVAMVMHKLGTQGKGMCLVKQIHPCVYTVLQLMLHFMNYIRINETQNIILHFKYTVFHFMCRISVSSSNLRSILCMNCVDTDGGLKIMLLMLRL